MPTQSWMARINKVALPPPFCTAPRKIEVPYYFLQLFCAMMFLIMDLLTMIHANPENQILNYCQIELE